MDVDIIAIPGLSEASVSDSFALLGPEVKLISPRPSFSGLNPTEIHFHL